jgi:2-oxoglutarate dehydrogenase E2 component (dihydrolipoamide succinyltransferase)
MPVELKVPAVGESVTEVQIGEWLKREGEKVKLSDAVVVIETDKATVELPAPVSGTVSKVLKRSGEAAAVGEVIGYMEEGEAVASSAPAAAPTPRVAAAPAPPASAAAAPAPVVVPARPAEPKPVEPRPEPARVMPAALRVMAENALTPEQVEATGPGGRVLKEDALRAVQTLAKAPAAASAPPPSPATPAPAPVQKAQPGAAAGFRGEDAVPMSPMRKRIAERLVSAQQTAALLTTFNEVDMTGVMTLRQEYQDSFQKQYNVKLGFMSFFVKAAIDALKRVPQLNAQIRDGHIVYHNYYDIGIAVGGGKGLVVPILRNAELMSFAEVEVAIADFGRRAQENRITLDELQGGTFTISNGGIYGSMLSTPIVNPPQSGILGLHAIQKRPVVVNDQIVIRSMMFVALTYDHRIVDGREAVTFLKRIKECVENPSRMLLEV